MPLVLCGLGSCTSVHIIIHRLPSSNIPVVFQKGRVFPGNSVYARAVSTDTGIFRLQTIIPVRITAIKVRQNYQKRKLKEAIHTQAIIPALSVDCLMIAKPAIISVSLTELSVEIESLFRKIEQAFLPGQSVL